MIADRSSQQVFFGTSALLFIGSTALTIAWCGSMSAMGRMPMPGGWAMSMTWMRMPGPTWIGAATTFFAMWIVMMTAMMLPSMIPMLWRYRQAVNKVSDLRRGTLTALAGIGYFFVWTLMGLAVYPLGVALATVEMDIPALARSVPVLIGAVILLAGVLQFTPWKARYLACCREAPGHGSIMPAKTGTAWQQGVRFGFHRSMSCANLTLVLLVIGVMDLRAMALIAAAITAERLAPSGERFARAIGVVIVGAGLTLILRAVELG